MSTVGKLLEELSWEHATSYRQGDRGRENVVGAEVMMALDSLSEIVSSVYRKGCRVGQESPEP